MNINIKGVDYKLYFGIDFLDYLDAKEGASVNVGGGAVKLPKNMMGFEVVYNLFKTGDTRAVLSILQGGFNTLDTYPTKAEIVGFLDGLLSDELDEETKDTPYSDLLETLDKELKKQPQTGIKIRKSRKDRKK